MIAHDKGLSCWLRVLALALLFANSVMHARPASTAPLNLNTCLSLWRQNLEANRSGISDLLASGAEGAQSRLSATQLGQVKSYIEQLEQLKFRCPRFVPPPPGAQSF